MSESTQSTDSDSSGPNVLLKILVYGLYAPVFVFLVVPNFFAQRTVNVLNRNPSILRFVGDSIRSLWYVKFFTDRNRARLFVRAMGPTPGQYLGFLPGEKVISSDPRVERENLPDDWDEIRSDVYARDDYTCQCCGATGGPDGDSVVLQADHVVPVSRGGNDDLPNLRTLCRSCHQARHARLFD